MLSESAQEWVQAWKFRDMEDLRQEGEAFHLLLQLERRFGPVPPWVRMRLREASSPQILEWDERVKAFNSDTGVLETIRDRVSSVTEHP